MCSCYHNPFYSFFFFFLFLEEEESFKVPLDAQLHQSAAGEDAARRNLLNKRGACGLFELLAVISLSQE